MVGDDMMLIFVPILLNISVSPRLTLKFDGREARWKEGKGTGKRGTEDLGMMIWGRWAS